jgi:type IV secretory pathway VirJ component
MRITAFLCLLLAIIVFPETSCLAEESTFTFRRFGTVTLYRQKPHPARVVLFVSGDGGWNKGVVDMARQLTGLDALVAGIDIVHYLRQLAASNEACSYPAADFENLSHFLQKKLDYQTYVQPVLIGYSSGATLVYATLAQAPAGTFLGAISLGFCPDLAVNKRFCSGSGLSMEKGPNGKGIIFLPCTHLKDPWIALQGRVDQVCDPLVTERFAGRVAQGEIVMLPKVGHGFSMPANWMPQLRIALLKLSNRPLAGAQVVDAGLADLPLVEVPAAGSSSDTLAVIISGDGGWAGVDRVIAAGFADAGIDVVGLNSLKYFWTPRTPEQLGADLDRVLRHYLGRWKKSRILLVGYSMGAEVLPFAVNRLSAPIRDQVRAVALLAPGRRATFAFHLSSWLGGEDADGQPVEPEVTKIKGAQILCFYGRTETDSLCQLFDGGRVKITAMEGGHHFGGKYKTLIQAIVNQAAP